jgi:Entner-Doudoroff aldolase
MSNFERLTALLEQHRSLCIVRSDDRDKAASAMDAAVRGGFRVIEFTMNTPGVIDLIARFSARDDLCVGAGTVMSTDDARRAVAAGAGFIVSPVIDEDVVTAARDLGVPSIPGAFTPTEMWRAHRAGAPFVKLFPAPGDGPSYVRQILGPMPFLRIVPTAGVDGENARAHLDAGAYAVGFVSSLFTKDDMAAQRWSAIEERAKRLLASLKLR